LNFEHNLFL